MNVQKKIDEKTELFNENEKFYNVSTKFNRHFNHDIPFIDDETDINKSEYNNINALMLPEKTIQDSLTKYQLNDQQLKNDFLKVCFFFKFYLIFN